MKTKLTLLTISSSLVLAAPALLAQDTNTNTNTNTLPLTQTVKYQQALENDRSLGERSLLPPGLKEKMKLTDEQRGELKPIEDDFANTCQQYQIANQPRIDAAEEANRQASRGDGFKACGNPALEPRGSTRSGIRSRSNRGGLRSDGTSRSGPRSLQIGRASC